MLIAVVNNKGGVGKSTLAVHAAVWLHEQGLPVAVLDADAHGCTSSWLSRAAPQIPVERYSAPGQMLEHGQRMQAEADLVLADGPAGHMAATAALIAVADRVLLPIGPSLLDVDASSGTARMIHRVRAHPKRKGLPEAITVLSRAQPRTRLARVVAAAAAEYGFPIASTTLHLRQAYADAWGRGSVVWRMGTAARAAATEIAQLFREVLDLQRGVEARSERSGTASGTDGPVVVKRCVAAPGELATALGRRAAAEVSSTAPPVPPFLPGRHSNCG